MRATESRPPRCHMSSSASGKPTAVCAQASAWASSSPKELSKPTEDESGPKVRKAKGLHFTSPCRPPRRRVLSPRCSVLCRGRPRSELTAALASPLDAARRTQPGDDLLWIGIAVHRTGAICHRCPKRSPSRTHAFHARREGVRRADLRESSAGTRSALRGSTL